MRKTFLWFLALVLTVLLAVWQRLSGPTWPVVGTVPLAGGEVSFHLPRAGEVGEDLRVFLEVPSAVTGGFLRFRRVPSREGWHQLAVAREPSAQGWRLVANLPAQPPAGKLAYQFVVLGGGQEAAVPPEPVVVRFRAHVPLGLLLSHIATMFTGMLLSNRLGLGAALGEQPSPRWTWSTLGFFAVGGLLFGPLVQKAAFGVFWSGFPVGRDLTDTKTLVFSLAWAVASVLAPWAKRWPVVVAFGVTLAAFAIPHSVWGSEIRWDQ